MLKIKGLKKKKKGKKGKHKEDDLFDPEELEQYRREHQQKQEGSEASETAGEGTSSTEKGEEWRKFQALTAGVDDILKKTQGDLDRIKSTSYYQRKPPGPSTSESKKEPKESQPETKATKWTRFAEDGSVIVEEELEQNQENNAEEVKHEFEDHPTVEEEEEDEDKEVETDLDFFCFLAVYRLNCFDFGLLLLFFSFSSFVEGSERIKFIHCITAFTTSIAYFFPFKGFLFMIGLKNDITSSYGFTCAVSKESFSWLKSIELLWTFEVKACISCVRSKTKIIASKLFFNDSHFLSPFTVFSQMSNEFKPSVYKF
uniref:Uncharacterized protein n=1 Tax=Graphocephala atropunctata TaxID=36148 RepID=A0A1B6LSY6_9HEMI